MSTTPYRPVTVHVPASGGAHDRTDGGGSRPVLLLAGVGFALSWIAGLSVFSSSTEVRSSGEQIQRAYAGHVGVVGLQYFLTEGLPAVLLAIVTVALSRAVRPEARAARAITGVAGLAAASVSVVQLALGMWLSFGLVNDAATGSIGTVYRAINRLDGVKMLLLAVLAATVIRAIHRGDLDMPRWFSWTATALTATITLSAIGYLTLDNTLASAAWLSLPCLIVFITGAAVVLHRRTVGDNDD
ncbi:MAG: hypothetical protein ACR2KJ_00210 [Jatrophihabitans sp.]